LGHCGSDKHGDLLRGILEDPKRWEIVALDGVWLGYLLLKPKEGWSYFLNRVKDTKQPFPLRFAAWRAMGFLWDNQVDVIPRQELLAGMASLLDDPEMADLALLDLRRWQRWEMADRVLDLFDRESHKAPIIRRSILRFALQCRGPRAAAFVREQRQQDPDLIRDIEEGLQLEAEGTPARTK
jgi:hypothetical protein